MRERERGVFELFEFEVHKILEMSRKIGFCSCKVEVC